VAFAPNLENVAYPNQNAWTWKLTKQQIPKLFISKYPQIQEKELVIWRAARIIRRLLFPNSY
jgi:hypothetical protein